MRRQLRDRGRAGRFATQLHERGWSVDPTVRSAAAGTLLVARYSPELLVMTSGNRASEPMAHTDEDARKRLGGIADAFLVGARAIARRVDDSVAMVTRSGPMVLRRARDLAPDAVASL
jgi:hydrogenase maturation factor HypF (carbamoyltransferase family)